MATCNVSITACEVMPSTFVTSSQNGGNPPFVEFGFASTGFLIVCSALVMIMTPGVGLVYSGLSRSQHALTIILICCLSYAVVTLQWVIWGFSLAFSENSDSAFIGNLDYVGLDSLSWQALPLTAPAVPGIAYALYQLQFATVTVALIFGSVIERIRIIPSMIFMFVWATLIYDPIAYWTWSARGWIRNMSCLDTTALGQIPCQIGGLDFAGGGPVHMCSGAAALAFSIFIGRRHAPEGVPEQFKAHSVSSIFIGTALVWMGWFGFNAGSAAAATPRAAYAGIVTTIAASAGALAWVFTEYAHSNKFSGIAFCSGAIAGLVAITPASGFVNSWSAIIIGIVAGVGCAFSIRIRTFFKVDDSTDVWAVHGVGGFIGVICTGLFASSKIAALDGTIIPGGAFFDRKGHLLGYNLAGALSILSYSFVGTMIILYVIDKIPGLNFRLGEGEADGDIAVMGETDQKFDLYASPSTHSLLIPQPASELPVPEVEVHNTTEL